MNTTERSAGTECPCTQCADRFMGLWTYETELNWWLVYSIEYFPLLVKKHTTICSIYVRRFGLLPPIPYTPAAAYHFHHPGFAVFHL